MISQTVSSNNYVRDYHAYLASDHWKSLVRRYIYTNRRACCFVCGASRRLQLHHVRYDHLYQEKYKRDIYIVCGPCHYKQHFWWVIKKPLKRLRLRLYWYKAVHVVKAILYDMTPFGKTDTE